MKKPENSRWLRRGFERKVRLAIYRATCKMNAPLRIPQTIVEQNPAVTIEEAASAYERFRTAAADFTEGTAAWARGERDLTSH
jgi:hypothetical protein